MSEVMRAWPPRLPSLQRPPPTAASMAHCLLLAALLHLWLVLVLGNAPGGTAEPGQGVWGAINVRLRGPVSDQAPSVPQPPVQPGGAPGQAAAERWGGAVRAAAAPALEEPGAEKLGHWGPRPDAAPATAPELSAPQALVPAELPALPAPPEARLVDTRLRAALPAGPAPVAALPAAPALAPLPLSTAPDLAVPAPAAQAAPLRALRAASPPSRAAPDSVPALPQAAPAPRAAPLQDIAVPQALPVAPPPAAVRTAEPPAEPTAERVAERVADPAPERVAEPLPQALAEPVLRPLQPSTPLSTPAPVAPQAVVPAALPAASAQALPSVPVPAANLSVPASVPAGAAATSLDAGARVGHDVATPASNAASVLPRLNLEWVRPRGGELSRGAARGVLPVLPRPPELDEKLARDIEKAAKVDCRKAYAGAGVLAVVPLAADALGKAGGCKW